MTARPSDRPIHDAKHIDVANAVSEVLDAWRIAGPSPDYHRRSKSRLAREWPTLYRALDDLDRKAPRVDASHTDWCMTLFGYSCDCGAVPHPPMSLAECENAKANYDDRRAQELDAGQDHIRLNVEHWGRIDTEEDEFWNAVLAEDDDRHLGQCAACYTTKNLRAGWMLCDTCASTGPPPESTDDDASRSAP